MKRLAVFFIMFVVLCSAPPVSAAFLDNADGTITDTATGLMWQQATAPGTYTWQQALAYCEDLNLAGHTDWRLPDRNELQSIVDYSRFNPAIDPIFSAVASYYWSSTTYAYYTHFAWYVDFYNGYVYHNYRTDKYYVRAVRSGQYVLLGDLGDLCIEDYHCDEGDVCVEGVCEVPSECETDDDCADGEVCVEGVCQTEVVDNPPALGDGPYLAAGYWPVLPTSAESPMYLDQNYSVLWTFSDDFASCSEDCTHSAEYQPVGGSEWTALDVTANAAKGFAYVDLPIDELQNATTYAFRFTVTDCAEQSTQSGTYYFRVATSDAPPVITGGPYLAAGYWPVLPTTESRAIVLAQNEYVLWTFSDDYAFCSGLCTHRARYKNVGDTAWTWITVSADLTGKKYAYAELPVVGLAVGTYQFHFDVRDCAGQRTGAPRVYYFKVE